MRVPRRCAGRRSKASPVRRPTASSLFPREAVGASHVRGCQRLSTHCSCACAVARQSVLCRRVCASQLYRPRGLTSARFPCDARVAGSPGAAEILRRRLGDKEDSADAGGDEACTIPRTQLRLASVEVWHTSDAWCASTLTACATLQTYAYERTAHKKCREWISTAIEEVTCRRTCVPLARASLCVW